MTTYREEKIEEIIDILADRFDGWQYASADAKKNDMYVYFTAVLEEDCEDPVVCENIISGMEAAARDEALKLGSDLDCHHLAFALLHAQWQAVFDAVNEVI